MCDFSEINLLKPGSDTQAIKEHRTSLFYGFALMKINFLFHSNFKYPFLVPIKKKIRQIRKFQLLQFSLFISQSVRRVILYRYRCPLYGLALCAVYKLARHRRRPVVTRVTRRTTGSCFVTELLAAAARPTIRLRLQRGTKAVRGRLFVFQQSPRLIS